MKAKETVKGTNGHSEPAAGQVKKLTITAPNMQTVEFLIEGTAPYVQNRTSEKARQQMHDQQEAGSKSKSRKARDPKDFQALYEGAKHVSREGWNGIPAAAFRAAMVSACRAANYVMTRAKLAVFIEADGFDAVDGTPLVRITGGEPEYTEMFVRNDSGVVDLRPRPMWREGWQAMVRIRFDADMLAVEDIANLMSRVGEQVGIGEGRPDSKNSVGMGWGTFRLMERES